MLEHRFHKAPVGFMAAWSFLVLLTLLGARMPAGEMTVPWSLGKGTGGQAPWSCSSAAHSPTTISVDAEAGPEGTAAAVLAFEFVSGKYNYNWADVKLGTVDPVGTVAVRLTYKTDVPAGFPGLSLMLRESSGGCYWFPRGLPLSPGRFTTQTVPLSKLTVPAWSKDANGKLDIELISEVCIGLETGNSGKGRVFIAEVHLVPAGW